MVSLNPDYCIYVGNLPGDVSNSDLNKLFKRYGNIVSIDLKINQPGPPFAFIEYDDCLDAEDAIRKRDGYQFYGHKLRVAYTNRGPDKSLLQNKSICKRERRDHGGSALQRSKYRVYVSGLPPTACWQDLKNHMQEAGKVCYADIPFKDGTGVVEYFKSRHMKEALRKMDDTKFRSHSGESSYIRVRKNSRSGKTRSRSRRSSAGGNGRRKKSHSRSSTSRSSSSSSSSTSEDDR